MNKTPLRPSNSNLLQRRPKTRRREFVVVAVALVVLFIGGFRWLEGGTGWLLSLARPFWVVEDYLLGGNQESQLVAENQALKLRLIDYDQVQAENESLRTILGRQAAAQAEPLVAKVISSPWRSPFDIVTVDLGEANSHGPIKVGDLVVYDHLALVGEVMVASRLTEFDITVATASLCGGVAVELTHWFKKL
jgi:cell shape-determining protein MreC